MSSPAAPTNKKSTWQYVAGELSPSNWNFFDYTGIAVGIGGATLSGLAAAGEAVAPRTFAAAIAGQSTDDVNKFMLPVTGLWAGNSALATMNTEKSSLKAWEDAGLSLVNFDVSTVTAAALTVAFAPEGLAVVGVILAASLVGFLASKAAKGLLDAWEANHPDSGGKVTTFDPDGTWTTTTFPNGDYITQVIDGSSLVYSAASHMTMDTAADQSKIVRISDDNFNVISSTSYDSAGNVISTTNNGISVAFDGNNATVAQDGQPTTLVTLAADSAGHATFEIDGGDTVAVDTNSNTLHILDASGNRLVTESMSTAADSSVTITEVDGSGNTLVKAYAADGNSVKYSSVDAAGNLLGTTTTTVDSTTGETVYESIDTVNGTTTTMTVSADGNTTSIQAAHADGSTSDTLIERGEGDNIRSTVRTVGADGTVSTEVAEIDPSGMQLSDDMTILGIDGSSIITKTDKDGTIEVMTDAKGDKATETIAPDGAVHIEWRTINGINGTEDIDSAGNVKESVTAHMSGADILGNKMTGTLYYDPTPFNYQQDVTYSYTKNANGSSQESIQTTSNGAFIVTTVRSGVIPTGGYAYGDIAIFAGWLDGQPPTSANPGILKNEYVSQTYVFDLNAPVTVYYAKSTDAEGVATISTSSSIDYGDEFADSVRPERGIAWFVGGDIDFNEEFAPAMAGLAPFIPITPFGKTIDFSALGNAVVATSSISGSVPDGTSNLKMSGNDNLTVTGNDLDDIISGNTGNDTFVAGTGNDTLIGGSGHNTFIAGLGNNKIIGGPGGSSIVYSIGNGDLSVINTLQSDTLNFRTGISINDISATSAVADDGSLSFNFAVHGAGSISIRAGVGYLDNIDFADGTQVTLEQLIQKTNPNNFEISSASNIDIPDTDLTLRLIGGASISAHANNLNDTIFANTGNDTLYAGIGSNTLVAGTGDDILVGNLGLTNYGFTTYEYDNGDGKSKIINSQYDDTIKFGSGIAISDLHTIYTKSPQGDDEIEIVSTAGVDIVATASDYGNLVRNLTFADGSSAQLSSLQSQTVSNDPQTYFVDPDNEKLDIFSSKTSDSLVFGGGVSNADLSARAATSGNGSVDFIISIDGKDSVELESFGSGDIGNIQTSFDQQTTTLTQLLVSDGQGITSFSDASGSLGGAVVTMHLTGSANLTATGNSLDDTIIANSGNDTLYAGTGNDTLVAGSGNDIFIGGIGQTTYRYELGDGTTTIENAGNHDIVQFGPGISANDLQSVITTSADGAITETISSNSGISVILAGDNTHSVAPTLEFSDGSTLISAWVHNTVDSDGPVKVSVASDGGLIVQAIGSNDESVIANDGAISIIANSGNDLLVGGSGINVLKAGIGNSVLEAGTGTNTLFGSSGITTYQYGIWDGMTTIVDAGSADIVQLQQGISADDVQKFVSQTDDGSQTVSLFSYTGMDLVLQGDASNAPLENLQFADGSYGSMSTIESGVFATGEISVKKIEYFDFDIKVIGMNDVTVHASSYNDTVTANSGNDTLIAGSGNDSLIAGDGNSTLIAGTGQTTMVGGSGKSTYVFALGDGLTTIMHAGEDDTLQFQSGIAVADLEKVVSNNVDGSQTISLVSASGVDVVLQGDSYHPASETLRFADGSILSTGSLETSILSSVAVDTWAEGDGGLVVQVLGTEDATVNTLASEAVVYANDGNDTLVAGSGSVLFIGGGGTTEFVSGSGDADFTGGVGISIFNIKNGSGAVDIDNTGSSDTLAFGSDVTKANLSVNTSVDGNGAVAYVFDADGTTVTLHDDSGDAVLSKIELADGSVMTLSGLLKANEESSVINSAAGGRIQAGVVSVTLAGNDDLTIYANDLDDVITGNSGNDIIFGGSGHDVLVSGSAKSVLISGTGGSTLIGGGAATFIASGIGNDMIQLNYGPSVVAFNLGDGSDTIASGSGTQNTLSLGGGILDEDLSLRKNNDDLILNVSSTDSLTFKDWYVGTANQNFANLQLIESASADYNPNSSNLLVNSAIEEFDFSKLVSQFDQARTSDTSLIQWNILDSLLTAHLSSSDALAIGGDLAHIIGTSGSFAGLSSGAALAALSDPLFGKAPQAVHDWTSASNSANAL